MNDFYQSSAEIYLQGRQEKKEIRFLGSVAGLCVIGYVIIQNVLSEILYATPLAEYYETDPTFSSVVTIFFSIFGMLIPFGLGGYIIGKRTNTNVFNFEKPVSIPLMISAVPFGFFICLIGNYVTSLFVTYMDSAGIHLSAPDYALPSDFSGRIVYAVSIAVVPALVEEFAIRGAVLQPLRKYGDKFAILASALLFAVLHGNLIQAPFALIAGIGLGYAVCITNSVWTGVLIHFCNNFYSVLTEFLLEDITDEEVINQVYLIMTVTLYAVSILGSVIFIVLKNRRKLMPSFTVLRERSKLFAYVTNIPMAIAIIIMFLITLLFISVGG
ncbi:MAG: CPBP family intramembrane metalloprotease [Clostridia bacterium]|nr:CPBP family intramembrane metalloprotease [Clostridia bacterium]